MFSLYCRSAAWIADGFQAAFEYIETLNADNDHGELLWRTRHKKVMLLEVPQEYAPENRTDCRAVWKFYGEKRFFRYLFRPSLAFRELRGYKLAASCGIPVAEVLAAAEKRRGVRLISSVFVTGFVAGSGDGDDFRPGGSKVADTALAREFAEKNLRLLAKLHRSGLIHGGFTPRNELYILKPEVESSDGNRLDVIWIDLATCRKVPWYKRKKLQQKDVDVFLSMLGLAPAVSSELLEIYSEELKKNG